MMASGAADHRDAQKLVEPKLEEGEPPLKTVKIEVKDEPLSDGEEAAAASKYHKSPEKVPTAASGSRPAHQSTSSLGASPSSAVAADIEAGEGSAAAAAAAADSKSKEEVETEERERMQVLVSNFTEDQLDRYEMYRRAAFPKAAIKRIMQNITGCSIGQNVVIAMSGISKVFAGEVVEEALDYMDQLGESGPLKPKHLREAARRLRTRGVFPRTKKQSALKL